MNNDDDLGFDPRCLMKGHEESWHYWRECKRCGQTWCGLHSPYDGHQNPCPGCGIRPDTEPEYPDDPQSVEWARRQNLRH